MSFRVVLRTCKTALSIHRRLLPQRTNYCLTSLPNVSSCYGRSLCTTKIYRGTNNSDEIRENSQDSSGVTKVNWSEVPVKDITLKDLGVMTKDEQVEVAERWIKSLTPEEKRSFDILKMEYDVMLSTGHHVPTKMEPYMWMRICMEPTYGNRRRSYRYFAVVEAQLRKAERKRLKKQEFLETKPEQVYRKEGTFQYLTTRRNSFLQRIERPTMNRHYYNNIYNALLWGQKLVFDFDYDELMRPQDIRNMVDQFLECHGHNRVHRDPYYFYICNAQPDSASVQRLYRSASCGPGGIEEYPFTITEKSYLDVFPRDKLVYLSPNAPNMLEEYNHEDVYIIGGLVDKIITQPVTMAKAKREGIRMAKFPMDLYFKFVAGSKSLSLDQVMRILLDMKVTGDWMKALQHIPKRKIIPMAEIRAEERQREEKRAAMMRKRAIHNQRTRYY